jgi:hypothetical protein
MLIDQVVEDSQVALKWLIVVRETPTGHTRCPPRHFTENELVTLILPRNNEGRLYDWATQQALPADGRSRHPADVTLNSAHSVRVRIIQPPTGSVDGVLLKNYLVGVIYDLPANIANYLVAQGFAVFESRRERGDSSKKDQRPTGK